MIYLITDAMTVNFVFMFSALALIIIEASETSERLRTGMKCYRCNYQLIERSCKLVCVNCGYSLECGDM